MQQSVTLPEDFIFNTKSLVYRGWEQSPDLGVELAVADVSFQCPGDSLMNVAAPPRHPGAF